MRRLLHAPQGVYCRVYCISIIGQKARADATYCHISPCVSRGDWIRTSDLLNPILGGEAAPSRRMSQVQAFWRLTDSTHPTVYADHRRKSTICPHFPGLSLPNPARIPARTDLLSLPVQGSAASRKRSAGLLLQNGRLCSRLRPRKRMELGGGAGEEERAQLQKCVGGPVPAKVSQAVH